MKNNFIVFELRKPFLWEQAKPTCHGGIKGKDLESQCLAPHRENLRQTEKRMCLFPSVLHVCDNYLYEILNASQFFSNTIYIHLP